MDEIAEFSPTLHAVLKKMLGDKPLRAKRILGCCGMNTDRLIKALADAINHVRSDLGEDVEVTHPDKHFSQTVMMGGEAASGHIRRDHYGDNHGTNTALKLLGRIDGIEVIRLFLDPSTVIRGETKRERRQQERKCCEEVLQYWVEAEVLGRETDSLRRRIENYCRNFTQLVEGEVITLDGLYRSLTKMRDSQRRADILLEEVNRLKDSIKRIEGVVSCGSIINAAAGKAQALRLLGESSAKIEKFAFVALPRFLGMPGAADLEGACARYNEEFSCSYRDGTTIGDGVLQTMKQQAQELANSLRTYGKKVWSDYMDFASSLPIENPPRILNKQKVDERVDGLAAKLDLQVKLLDKLIKPAGFRFVHGLNNRGKTLDEVIEGVTAFLQINLPVEAAELPVAATVAREVGPGDVVVVIEDKPAEPSGATVPTDHELVAVAANTEKPLSSEPPVASDALAPRSNPAAFFPAYVREFGAPPSNLSEAQKDGIDKVVKFIAQIRIEGVAFPRSKLESIVNFLTDSIDHGIASADDLAPGIVTRLHTPQNVFTVQWLTERGVTTKLETLLLMQHSSAPSP